MQYGIKFWFEIGSAAFALAAAALWLRSAMIKTPHQFPIAVQTANVPQHLVIGPTMTGYGESKELDDLGRAVIRQSWWSAAAAFNAAMAAILQAILALQHQPWFQWLK
jgi:hypothetical protein